MRPETTPPHQVDLLLRYGHMAERVGAAIALILALIARFGLWTSPMSLHIGSGLLALAGIVLAAVRLSRAAGGTLLWVAAMVFLVGAWVGLGRMSVLMHVVTVLVAVGLAELGILQSAGLPQKRR